MNRPSLPRTKESANCGLGGNPLQSPSLCTSSVMYRALIADDNRGWRMNVPFMERQIYSRTDSLQKLSK